MKVQIAALLALMALFRPAIADVSLPSVLGDRMVLQQLSEVCLWGWAYEGETVFIETSWGEKAEAKANERGEWRARVRTPRAQSLSKGLHHEYITFSVPNENAVQLRDVLIGEVWLCSGQSNMTMMLGPDFPPGHNGWYGEKFSTRELKRGDRPALRVFNVEKTARYKPQDDCKGTLPDHITMPRDKSGLMPAPYMGWQICSAQTAPYISAVAYYFGAMLEEKLDVPVGLITSTVGGSSIEAWMSLEALRQLPRSAGASAGAGRNAPAALFNGMIAPLAPITMRGVIWYQGESNLGTSSIDYAVLLRSLILDWRSKFAHDNLPFGIVQLANFGKTAAAVSEAKAASIREAQAQVAAEVEQTGLIVTIDLGAENIHPPDKRNVALRLSLWARAQVYGEDGLSFRAPQASGALREGKGIEISFNKDDSLLIVGTSDPEGSVSECREGKLASFEIAGGDGVFVPAEAVIRGGKNVFVSSSTVPFPQAVRYAWAENPDGCNLYSQAGLPVSPFRLKVAQPQAGLPFIR